ncbi:MAG TPA: hypothetical protein VHE55_01305 [Fimbriimonadaceae bacterium]|nr:hypothetical protein [Fimbriimonadaceae bacterium]
MITCQLTKLESALDQLKKSYPKLRPADAVLLVSALTLTGRHALAIYEDVHYTWPEEYDKLTKAMVAQLQLVQEGIENSTPKRAAKSTAEEEPVTVNVGLAPNLAAGEKLLEDRNDLKALLSEILQKGVEFVYSGIDIGWQWALDRANWTTIADQEMSRRIKIKCSFTEGAVGVEMGTTTPKKRSSKKVAAVAEPEPAAESEPAADEAEAAE